MMGWDSLRRMGCFRPSDDGLNLCLWCFFAVGTAGEASQIFSVPLRTGALPLLASFLRLWGVFIQFPITTLTDSGSRLAVSAVHTASSFPDAWSLCCALCWVGVAV